MQCYTICSSTCVGLILVAFHGIILQVKNCTVSIVEDNTYEVDEIFHVKLGDPQGNEVCPARVGKNKTATVTIVDKEDGEYSA